MHVCCTLLLVSQCLYFQIQNINDFYVKILFDNDIKNQIINSTKLNQILKFNEFYN